MLTVAERQRCQLRLLGERKRNALDAMMNPTIPNDCEIAMCQNLSPVCTQATWVSI